MNEMFSRRAIDWSMNKHSKRSVWISLLSRIFTLSLTFPALDSMYYFCFANTDHTPLFRAERMDKSFFSGGCYSSKEERKNKNCDQTQLEAKHRCELRFTRKKSSLSGKVNRTKIQWGSNKRIPLSSLTHQLSQPRGRSVKGFFNVSLGGVQSC